MVGTREGRQPLNSAVQLGLSAAAFEEDEHEEGEEQVEFFTICHVADFVDLEAAFPEGGLFGQAHGRGAVIPGREVLGVTEVAGQKADDWDFT